MYRLNYAQLEVVLSQEGMIPKNQARNAKPTVK